jgi:hypothetical protein
VLLYCAAVPGAVALTPRTRTERACIRPAQQHGKHICSYALSTCLCILLLLLSYRDARRQQRATAIQYSDTATRQATGCCGSMRACARHRVDTPPPSHQSPLAPRSSGAVPRCHQSTNGTTRQQPTATATITNHRRNGQPAPRRGPAHRLSFSLSLFFAVHCCVLCSMLAREREHKTCSFSCLLSDVCEL